MKKITILPLLCTLFLSFVHIAHAQQKLVMVNTSTVAYTTFTKDDGWIVFKNNEPQEIGENSFEFSCDVSFGKGVKSLNNKVEIGVCYSSENTIPTINDKKIDTYMYSHRGTEPQFTFTVEPLALGTTYYYRVYWKLLNDVFYGDVAEVTTSGTPGTPLVDDSRVINGHKFVDLELPSGLLWAETNIGADEDYYFGNFFAWGETEPKADYDWSNYKYATVDETGALDSLTKYNSTDGKTRLELEDDAAYVNWGALCRMPTKKEFEELVTCCSGDYCSKKSSVGQEIFGYRFVSKKNENSIFLPFHLPGCSYWSLDLKSEQPENAWSGVFDIGGLWNAGRCQGRAIRPVAEP